MNVLRGFHGLTIVLIALTGAVAAQGPPDRSRPPALLEPPELDLPPIQKHALSNGLPVWLVESHEVPIVQINLVVLAGSGDDPAAGFGTASLTAAMLDEGAGARSALEIADAIEFAGAALTTTSSFDASAVRLNVPVARMHDALPIMADVAMRPAFPQEDLERLRQERITSLLQARDDPASIAAMAFARILFGPEHRYGTGAIGMESTVKALTADDLRAFHQAFYQPSNAALIVVGDTTADAALPMLEQHFGAWKGTAQVRRTRLADAPQPAERRITIVDKPDAEQSQIRIGWIGVPRSTPDYFPLVVLNTVLGGSFSSRLNQNLREEHGYAYGAGSSFEMRLSPGPFVASAGVQTDSTGPALREFFNELTGIAARIPDAELTRAKNFIALGFPGAFETSGDLSRALESIVVYGLPEDYYDRYVDNVQAVTGDMVEEAAARYVHPTRAAVVVVGDRAAIEADIRALNLAPVRVMTVDEALGR